LAEAQARRILRSNDAEQICGADQPIDEGILAVNACGGITMAQDAASSANFDIGKADIVMPPARMATAVQVIADQWAHVRAAVVPTGEAEACRCGVCRLRRLRTRRPTSRAALRLLRRMR